MADYLHTPETLPSPATGNPFFRFIGILKTIQAGQKTGLNCFTPESLKLQGNI
jgi:hypothetical protein